MYNLLHDPIIGIRLSSGATENVSLPALLHYLTSEKVDSYTGLRAHQTDLWRVFLVQLGASILARHPENSVPKDENDWRDGLLRLSGGSENAWHLWVEDITQPAFMQHPLVGTEDFENYSVSAHSPDELDILVTAKNHDLKKARARGDAIELWLYSLLSIQTASGFLGSGHYGSIRMNGGFASRSIVSMTSSLNPSLRFKDELARVVKMFPELCSTMGYSPKGTVLTWLKPWSRQEAQYTLETLSPLFIEAVRPIRFLSDGPRLIAYGANSKTRQIGPISIDHGDIADPWTPINVADKKKGRSALTLSANGWTPKLLCNLLFQQGYELTALQTSFPGKEPLWFTGSVVVRGQGKTEGFHKFSIPVPPKVRLKLFNRDAVDVLSQSAQELLNDAAAAERCLWLALMVLIEGGPESVNTNSPTAEVWAKSARADFITDWQKRFFQALWRIDSPENSKRVRAEWRAELISHARKTLFDSFSRVPLASARYYRATVLAEATFNRRIKSVGLTSTEAKEPTND